MFDLCLFGFFAFCLFAIVSWAWNGEQDPYEVGRRTALNGLPSKNTYAYQIHYSGYKSGYEDGSKELAQLRQSPNFQEIPVKDNQKPFNWKVNLFAGLFIVIMVIALFVKFISEKS